MQSRLLLHVCTLIKMIFSISIDYSDTNILLDSFWVRFALWFTVVFLAPISPIYNIFIHSLSFLYLLFKIIGETVWVFAHLMPSKFLPFLPTIKNAFNLCNNPVCSVVTQTMMLLLVTKAIQPILWFMLSTYIHKLWISLEVILLNDSQFYHLHHGFIIHTLSAVYHNHVINCVMTS